MKITEIDGDDGRILFTKGHVDKDEFTKAILGMYGTQALEEISGDYYTWLRCSPDNSGEHDCLIVDGVPGKQGSFPATVTRATRDYADYTEYPKMPDAEEWLHG